ncbi:MAG TPA: DUF4350 domain-containing protein [Candidatus Acidoferrales bacterium]
MPFAIDPSDRKLVYSAVALFVVLGSALAFFAPPKTQESSSIPSIYSVDSNGAHAAYLLLKQLHYPVRVWERPPNELPDHPVGVVLILADPAQPPVDKDRAALLNFVKAGGRVLFTGSMLTSFFKDAHSSDEPLQSSWQTYDSNVPSNFTAGAPKISLQPEAEWATIEPSQLPLYGPADSAVVVSWRLGRGEILWWAGATPLTNAGITHDGNLNLFLNALSSPTGNASGQATIYWDEYFHGQRASLWAYVEKTPVAWGLLQIAILGFAVLFTFSRRSGPIAMPAAISRLWPLEFVDTIGGLYERAHAEPAMVGAVYQRFRSLLARQLRLPLTTTDAALSEAVRVRLGLKSDELGETLHRAAAASRAAKVPPTDALEIIHRLESLEADLVLKRKK